MEMKEIPREQQQASSDADVNYDVDVSEHGVPDGVVPFSEHGLTDATDNLPRRPHDVDASLHGLPDGVACLEIADEEVDLLYGNHFGYDSLDVDLTFRPEEVDDEEVADEEVEDEEDYREEGESDGVFDDYEDDDSYEESWEAVRMAVVDSWHTTLQGVGK